MAADIPDWTQSVTISSGTVTLAGTSDVNVTGGTVNANITNATVPVSGSVSISSGTVDISAGTVTVQNKTGTVIRTGAHFDVLKSGTATTTGTPEHLAITIPAATVGKDYAAIMVTVLPGVTVTAYCAVVLVNATTSHDRLRFASEFGKTPDVTNAQQQAIVPVVASAGVEIVITVWFSGSATVSYAVYGLTANPGVQLRDDGRAYPLGNLNGSGAIFKTASDTVTMVSAPASPLRIFVKSVDMVVGTATAHVGTLKVQETGGVQVLAFAYQVKGGVVISKAWEGGKLLSPGKSLQLVAATNGTTTVSASAVVDYGLIV